MPVASGAFQCESVECDEDFLIVTIGPMVVEITLQNDGVSVNVWPNDDAASVASGTLASCWAGYSEAEEVIRNVSR